MPEGPEIKTIANQLQAYNGATLYGIGVIGGRFAKDLGDFRPVKSVVNDLDRLEFPLFNADIGCKGKFLYWKFKNGINLGFTLGMTGSFTKQKTKHSALSFNLGNSLLYFTDPRHFGTFTIFDDLHLEAKLNRLGWDPLQIEPNQKINDFILTSLTKKENKTIAEVLLDQTIFAGLGNYLRSEILYDCKIHPNRLCKNLLISEIFNIAKSFYNISNQSYQLRGATLSTYKDVDGNYGKFSDMLKVYGKKQCPNGYMVKKIAAKDSRTVHYVEEVQK